MIAPSHPREIIRHGMPTCSSVMINLAPGTALASHQAFVDGDKAGCKTRLREFHYPFAVRDRCLGHGVAAAKAGVQMRGFDASPVRAPLTDPTEEEVEMMRNLIDGRG